MAIADTVNAALQLTPSIQNQSADFLGSAINAMLSGSAQDQLWQDKLQRNYTTNQQWAKDGPYNTQLSPEEEMKFRAWVSASKAPFNANDSMSDYDMRGYWKDVVAKGGNATSVNPNDNATHYPDTYKTPYHQSFSKQSKYATGNAPDWANEHQLVDSKGNVVFDERPQAKPSDISTVLDQLTKP